MVEERRGMELSRIFACGLACAGCAANPEQNCRERFKASLAPYFRPTFERISRVHTLFRALCVCVYALLVLLESVRPVDYDKCCRGKL